MILSRVLSVWHLKPKGKKLNQLKTGVDFQLLSLHSLCLLSLLDCLLGTWLLNLINMLLLFPLSDTGKLELIEYWLTELVTARHCYQPPACSLVCARAEDELGAHQAAACRLQPCYTWGNCHLQQQAWGLTASLALLLMLQREAASSVPPLPPALAVYHMHVLCIHIYVHISTYCMHL